MLALTRGVSKIEWGISEVLSSRAGTRDLFLRYISLVFTDLDNFSDPVLKIALDTQENVSLVINGNALDVLQAAAKRRNGLQFFTWRVNVELVISAVGDVEGRFREIDCLRRK